MVDGKHRELVTKRIRERLQIDHNTCVRVGPYIPNMHRLTSNQSNLVDRLRIFIDNKVESSTKVMVVTVGANTNGRRRIHRGVAFDLKREDAADGLVIMAKGKDRINEPL